MSLKLGTQDIAGISTHTNVNAHSLFDCKWADHKLNEISWLEASTFSWQSGDVYVTAYNHLVQDIQGIEYETETIGNYTVTFYRATDGHKICLADQEQTVLNIYNSYGIAWYYIVDTVNAQFKLPRTKFGFEGLRTNVGDKIAESLPNIKGSFSFSAGTVIDGSGSFYLSQDGAQALAVSAQQYQTAYRENFDASLSSPTYQDNAPVQERATQMYLYFYVGDYTQSAVEQTAGLNSELFNGKVELNASNLSAQGTSYISGLGKDSDTYDELVFGATGTTYNAPANGIYRFCLALPANSYFAIFNNNSSSLTDLLDIAVADLQQNYVIKAEVRKGQTIRIQYSSVISNNSSRFYYAKGSEWEAQ